MNNSKDDKTKNDKIQGENTSQEKTNNTEKTSKPQKLSKFGVFALVAACFIVLLAITMTVVMFVVSLVRGEKSEQGNLSDYLTVFAILITLISIVVPITSYITNKDEVKRLSEEFDKTRDELKETAEKEQKKFVEKTNILDIKYAELLENIVNKSTVTNDDAASDYAKAHILYVNALTLFQNGTYDKCKKKLDEAIKIITELKIEEANINDAALLIYKSLNLYRKALGRTRFKDDRSFEYINSILVKYKETKKSNIYKVAAYMYVTISLDRVEKSFTKNQAFQLSEGIDQLIDTLKSDELCGNLYYFTLLARKYQVMGYFTNDLNYHRDAIENAKKACESWDNKKAIDNRKEAEKRLDTKSAFAIAKVLEKSSFVYDKNTKEDLLNQAKAIVEQLISIDKNCKYFLELSEIYKKLGDQEKYAYAAEYGLSLSPSDSLLAAQCAYIYLRRYFANTNNLAYLIKAEEHLSTAYWVYLEEKDRYNDKSNSKLHYIASLHAVISAFTLISTGKTTVGEEEQKIVKNIYNSIDNSIADNPNNVPNYKRALLVYVGLAEQFADDKAEYLDKIKVLLKKYKENVTLKFDGSSTDAKDNEQEEFKMDFKEFAETTDKIDVDNVAYEQIVEAYGKIFKYPQHNI